MINSGSGSSFEFSELRIQAKVPDPCGSGSNPYYSSIFGNYKNAHHKFCQKEECTYQLSAIFYFILQSYSTGTTELKDDRMENSINGSRYRHILHYCGGCARRYRPGPLHLHAATPYPTPTQSCCLLHKLETPVC